MSNYKNKFNANKYKYKKNTRKIQETKNYKRERYQANFSFITERRINHLIFIIIICFVFFPFLLYSFLLIAMTTFKGSNKKYNYNKKYLDIIKTINPCLFIYDILTLFFAYILSYRIYFKHKNDYVKKITIKIIIMIFISLVNILFESLVIWKLVLSYKIKKGGCTWFMVLDYLFLVFNLIYTISIFLIAKIFYPKETETLIHYKIEYFLINLNDITIDIYELPSNFGKMPKKKRKEYVFQNYKNYSHNISYEQKELIKSINDLRGINNIPLLGSCQIRQIPDFLINELSEVMMWPERNIFKLSNKKYLFKFPIGQFKINFKNKDKDIFSILLKENLNHIQIITHQNIEYVFIYELDFCKFSENEFECDSDRVSRSARKRLINKSYLFNERNYIQEVYSE